MFQKQTKWKLSALLLAAPLLMPVAARADTDQNYDADQMRGTLKDVFKWRNAEGEIYLFHRDGHFERRAGRDAKFKEFSKQFGRFIVRPANNADNLSPQDRVVLQLDVTSFVPRGGKNRVSRSARFVSPLRAMSRYADGSGGNDTGAGGPDLFYIKISDDRFDDGRSG